MPQEHDSSFRLESQEPSALLAFLACFSEVVITWKADNNSRQRVAHSSDSDHSSYRGIDPCEDTERLFEGCFNPSGIFVTGASIRVRILKVSEYLHCSRICSQWVTGASIRVRILKAAWAKMGCITSSSCYRGIDPCEDTESTDRIGGHTRPELVTGASIRVRILKAV